jgi:hypothetical protein
MKTKRKEFILRAHRAACSDWKKQIEYEFPNLFKKKEVKFKEGDWVYSTDDWCHHKGIENRIFRVRESSPGGYVYMYLNDLNYTDKSWNQHISSLRKATPKEIEEHLLKEVERRGYKKGNFKCLWTHKFNSGLSVEYNAHEDRLWLEYGEVYEKGNWAEIIAIPESLQKAIDELGREKIVEMLKKDQLKPVKK